MKKTTKKYDVYSLIFSTHFLSSFLCFEGGVVRPPLESWAAVNVMAKSIKKVSNELNVGDDIIEGLVNVLAFSHGDRCNVRVHMPSASNVREIRKTLRMSRERFAKVYGFDPELLRDWEQGRRCPDQIAQAYLKVIAKMPKEVATVLYA